MAGTEWVDIAVELTAADGTRLRLVPDPDPVHPWRLDISDPWPLQALRAGVADGLVHAQALRLVLEVPGLYTVTQVEPPG